MININLLLKNNKLNLDLEPTVAKSYNEFIKISDIPPAYVDHNIDLNKLPQRVNTLNTHIYDIISNRYSYAFNVKNYSDTGKMTSLLLDTYFTQCVINEVTPEKVLYVDTNLILEDYKKLMDVTGNNSDYEMSLAHNLVTLTKNVENVPYVFWDKFSIVCSTYEKQKLYNILLIRLRRGLGNIFYIKNAPKVMSSFADDEITTVMNIDQLVNFDKQDLVFLNNTKDGGMLW